MPAARKTSAALRCAGTVRQRPEPASSMSKGRSVVVSSGAAVKASWCTDPSGQPASRACVSTEAMKPAGPQT
jgi:hypothetical protein